MASYDRRPWWSRHGLTARLADESFLEAAVTCAVLIAAADGQASEQEYDALLDRLELLGGVDRDTIDDLVTRVTNELESSGFEPRLERVGELLGDRSAAEAAFMLGMAIALADNDVSAEEREIARQLADAIGLAGLDLDATIVELRR
jgi:tellurite resistance protein